MSLMKPMGSLSAFPEELLSIIIEQVPSKSLPKLALASRNFHRLAVPFLYRFVEYSLTPFRGSMPAPVEQKYGIPRSLSNIHPSRVCVIYDLRKFIETLESNDSLRARIKGASVEIRSAPRHLVWWLQTKTHSTDYSTSLIAHMFALISPTLQYLEMKPFLVNLTLLSLVPNTSLMLYVPHLFATGWDPWNGEQHEEENLDHPSHLRGIFSTETLRHLTLERMDIKHFYPESEADEIADDPRWVSGFSTSSITSLSFPNLGKFEFDDDWSSTSLNNDGLIALETSQLNFALVSKLVGWTRRLESFHMGSYVTSLEDARKMVSKSGLLSALIAHAGSLKELFIDFPSSISPSIQPTPSFAAFADLKRLGLPSQFLPFNPSDKHFNRASPKLRNILPASLEDLQLEFGGYFENFRCMALSREGATREAASQTLSIASTEFIELSLWLSEILVHRGDDFPRLRHIVLWHRVEPIRPQVLLRLGSNVLKNIILGEGGILAGDVSESELASFNSRVLNKYVEYWLHYFYLPASFENAGVRLTWSNEAKPPLFNAMLETPE